ncbi:MAG: UbiA family prenyltransferase [Akkermansiaceae bacterium]|nr:UbiA family prenyltransferase [Akkermansiaceae bacterium]
MRVANLPSVVSNVWVGVAFGIVMFESDPNRPDFTPVPMMPTLLLVAGACSLYLGGCFLNDWKDFDWDLRNRTERALPRGLFQRVSYLASAVGCLLVGVSLALLANPMTWPAVLVVVVSVLLYTWVHKRAVWSVVPMGFCRGALPFLGALGFASPGQTLGGLLFLCVSGLRVDFLYNGSFDPGPERISTNDGGRRRLLNDAICDLGALPARANGFWTDGDRGDLLAVVRRACSDDWLVWILRIKVEDACCAICLRTACGISLVGLGSLASDVAFLS